MPWRIALFVALNILDIGISHYSISSGAAVSEGNPCLNWFLAVGGWPLAWVFKVSGAVFIALLLYSWLPRNICNRMLTALCIGFGLVVIYLLGVVAWSQCNSRLPSSSSGCPLVICHLIGVASGRTIHAPGRSPVEPRFRLQAPVPARL
jgi:Domain of unknown function (DUF5658)